MGVFNLAIAAHEEQDHIVECYTSIMNQEYPSDWKINLMIGVDNCEKTAKVLDRAGIPYYWSPENKGAYIIRNTLLHKFHADIYGYFDADDAMIQGYIKKTIKAIQKGSDAVMTAKYQCNSVLAKRSSKAVIDDGGAISMAKRVLSKLGGYHHWRCAGDSDFMRRLEKAGFKITYINEGLYYRRIHKKSLTNSETTKIGGDYRKKAWKDMCDKREQGVIYVQPEMIKLEYRE